MSDEYLINDGGDDEGDIREDFANKYVAKRIRNRRKERGMYQKDLAMALGCTYQQIQKYEKGINRITVAKLTVFARALDASTSYFLEGLDEALGQNSAGLHDQHQVDWIMDQSARDLAQKISMIENPSSRKQLLSIADHLASLESLAKELK